MPEARTTTLLKNVALAAIACTSFFLVLELSLRAIGVQSVLESEDPFRGFSGLVPVYERDGDVYRTRRIVASGVASMTFNEQSFGARKAPGAVRIFTLGGSSAYGYPWTAEESFTGILGDLLSAAHPGLAIESVNAAGVSYAMHRLRFVAREILDYEPDILVVFSGHNEFVESSFFQALKRRSPRRNRMGLALARSRVWSAARKLLIRPAASPSTDLDAFSMTVRRNEARTFSDDEKRTVIDGFREGLVEVVRMAHGRGVRVLLATLPCNLRQWKPGGSSFDPPLDGSGRASWQARFRAGTRALDRGAYADAAAQLEGALALAPSHAETHYRLAEAREGLGEWDRARRSYERAADHDASPIRRVSGINRAIREVASQEGALLVDVERAFQQHSEHGLVGLNLIEDYVHPTLEGHRLIAWELWRAMAQAGWLGSAYAPRRELFEQVVARRPERPRDSVWSFNQAFVLEQQGHLDRAVGRYREALRMNEGHAAAHHRLGNLLRGRRQLEEAAHHLGRAVQLDPGSARGHDSLASALHALGKTDEAIRQVRKALALDPDLVPARVHLGIFLYDRGRTREGLAELRKALETDSASALAHLNLGITLALQGQPLEAVPHLREVLRLEPDHENLPLVHYNLAQALVAADRPGEAVEHLREAVALQPDFARAHVELSRLTGLEAGAWALDEASHDAAD